jgi:hypothetical protein
MTGSNEKYLFSFVSLKWKTCVLTLCFIALSYSSANDAYVEKSRSANNKVSMKLFNLIPQKQTNTQKIHETSFGHLKWFKNHRRPYVAKKLLKLFLFLQLPSLVNNSCFLNECWRQKTILLYFLDNSLWFSFCFSNTNYVHFN